MSQITENTIVIKKENETAFIASFKKAEQDYMSRPKGLLNVYDNEGIVVYVFDCNGQPLFLEDDNVPMLIWETCFGKRDIYTQTPNGDSRNHCRSLLKKYVHNAEEMESLKKRIEYTF